MKIYAVGPNLLESCEFNGLGEKFEFVVYWYETGSYEGDGMAVFLGKDGLIHTKELGHCSCHGPMENNWQKPVTITEFFRPREDIFEMDWKECIKSKVKSLL